MKKYINEENITAVVIVVVGFIVASVVAPTVIGWFNAAKAKVTGA